MMRKTGWIIVACCLLLFPVVGPPILAQCTEVVDLTGTVVESGTGLPIPDVQVCVAEYCNPPCKVVCNICTKTNDTGYFHIHRVCDLFENSTISTWFFLHFSKEGYEPLDLDGGRAENPQPTCYPGLVFELTVDFQTVHLTKESSGILETPVGEIPTQFELRQNYPNPFNLGTTIAFTLAKPAEAELTVYDILGRAVQTQNLGRRRPGAHQVFLDGRDHKNRPLQSGVYFYRLTAGDFTQAKRMVLLK